MSDFAAVRRLALAMPGVEDGLSYGAPALKVRGKLFVRFRDDLDAVVLRMPFARREALLAEKPEVYFITDHYLKYEWILARLAAIRAPELRRVLQEAYEAAEPPVRAASPRRKRH